MTDEIVRRCIECDELIHGDDWRLDGMLYVHPDCYQIARAKEAGFRPSSHSDGS